ncbi:hypothetical protein D4R42_01850, partial [bacterium]
MIQNKKSKKDNRFIDLLLESRSFKELQLAFDKLLFKPLWWSADKKSLAGIKPLFAVKRAREMQDYLLLADYRKSIMRSMTQAQRSGQPVGFGLKQNDTFGVTVPVVKEAKLVGFFGMYALKSTVSDALSEVLSGYVKSITEEINKGLELARLYELVRPRAIALSTVHTIHRLISSTLDIKELFPRIARLSLQILKAERARICMLNQETKKLECISSVDYRKSKDLFKLNSNPTPIEARVFKTGRSVYRENILCVPLVDEDVCGVIIVRDKIGTEKFSIFDREIIATLA